LEKLRTPPTIIAEIERTGTKFLVKPDERLKNLWIKKHKYPFCINTVNKNMYFIVREIDIIREECTVNIKMLL